VLVKNGRHIGRVDQSLQNIFYPDEARVCLACTQHPVERFCATNYDLRDVRIAEIPYKFYAPKRLSEQQTDLFPGLELPAAGANFVFVVHSKPLDAGIRFDLG